MRGWRPADPTFEAVPLVGLLPLIRDGTTRFLKTSYTSIGSFLDCISYTGGWRCFDTDTWEKSAMLCRGMKQRQVRMKQGSAGRVGTVKSGEFWLRYRSCSVFEQTARARLVAWTCANFLGIRVRIETSSAFAHQMNLLKCPYHAVHAQSSTTSHICRPIAAPLQSNPAKGKPKRSPLITCLQELDMHSYHWVLAILELPKVIHPSIWICVLL